MLVKGTKILNCQCTFDHSSLYCALPVLNANVRAFNSRAESPDLHTLYFGAILPEEQKHCPVVTQLFLFQFLVPAHSTKSLTFGLLKSEEGQKEKSFFFPPKSSLSA